MRSKELYIGLMSGTSIDGIDAALVCFAEDGQTVIGYHSTPWPYDLGERLRSIATPGGGGIEELGALDAEVADAFSKSVFTLLQKTGVPPRQIRAIGSHGQTIRHRPDQKPPFTLQIGDPNRIAELTGINVVADFRRRDIAAGGQGAPLVPAYHASVFSKPGETRAVVNIGGIANVTLLPPNQEADVIGFDTGPGNTLLNYWIRSQLGEDYDRQGQWAAKGIVDEHLLEELLSDPYFALPCPKSTGPEYFSVEWLTERLHDSRRPAENVQATLTALSARSISLAIEQYSRECEKLIVCGGGVENLTLMQLLREYLPESVVTSSGSLGIAPEQVEAIAFAWLAMRTLHRLPGNLPAVTGASHPVVLGGIYLAESDGLPL